MENFVLKKKKKNLVSTPEQLCFLLVLKLLEGQEGRSPNFWLSAMDADGLRIPGNSQTVSEVIPDQGLPFFFFQGNTGNRRKVMFKFTWI